MSSVKHSQRIDMNMQSDQPEKLDRGAQVALRNHFLAWQCRIRQIAMRDDAGRPSAGMTPRCIGLDGEEIVPALIILVVPLDSYESTAFFKHQVRKTADPRSVYEKGLEFLQSTHFQNSSRFSDELTALFAPESSVAAALLDRGDCVLEFGQFNQTYSLPCSVRELPATDPAREATLWHNRIFNPEIPAGVHILGFQPDWSCAQAKPPAT